MNMRIGGWTRIWLVWTMASFGLSFWSNFDDLNHQYRQADESYQSAVETAQWHKAHPANATAQQGSAIDALIARDLSDSPPLTEAQARARRDAQKKMALAATWKNALIQGTVPSAILGVFFMAIGWIRAGFRKRA